MAQLQHLHNTQPKKGIYEFLLQEFTSEPPGKFTMCALCRVLPGKHLQGKLAIAFTLPETGLPVLSVCLTHLMASTEVWSLMLTNGCVAGDVS